MDPSGMEPTRSGAPEHPPREDLDTFLAWAEDQSARS
jgi:hypothetical protein